MAEFRVNVDRLSNNVSEIYRFSGLCNDYSSEIGNLDFSCLSDNIAARVGLTRNILSDNLSQIGKHFYRLSYGLDEISNRYRETENELLGTSVVVPTDGGDGDGGDIPTVLKDLLERIKKIFEDLFPTPYEINNIVFDDYGLYGGDQGEGLNLSYYDLMCILNAIGAVDVIRREGERDFFENLNREGCGYVAMANVIFQQYLGRPDDFERDFGFPMYRDDDHNPRTTDDLNFITLAAYLYYNHDTEAYGTNPWTRENILEQELGSRGIDINVEVYDYDAFTKTDISNYLRNGNEVLISINNQGPMYSMNDAGELVPYPGGVDSHVMEITGVTADGYYKVSSWGQEFYLKPEDFDTSQITYEVVYD